MIECTQWMYCCMYVQLTTLSAGKLPQSLLSSQQQQLPLGCWLARAQTALQQHAVSQSMHRLGGPNLCRTRKPKSASDSPTTICLRRKYFVRRNPARRPAIPGPVHRSPRQPMIRGPAHRRHSSEGARSDTDTRLFGVSPPCASVLHVAGSQQISAASARIGRAA